MSRKDMFTKSAGAYTYGGSIWIDKAERSFIGPGKINFLELVKEHGSISKAAAALGMSYSKAWGLVDAMNSLAEKPLVIKKTGGAGGGGAELTEEAERILEIYHKFCNNFEAFLMEQKELIGQL